MIETATESSILEQYQNVRLQTERLCDPLQAEDFAVQPIGDVSPPKWHLGHTTWFFETFILKGLLNQESFDSNYDFLFNSYYESVGARILRTNRGNITRPSVDAIRDYRKAIDDRMAKILSNNPSEEILKLTELGLHHEQQHQELLLADIKYILGHNPLFPTYLESKSVSKSNIVSPLTFTKVDGGMYAIGHEGDDFAYDNEFGKHHVFLHDFGFADRLTTNGEFLEFITDKGYSDFRHWLSAGWQWIQDNEIDHPLYWHKIRDEWHEYTLAGLKPIDLAAPVTHISYFEAEAFAQWKGKRLLTEFEWEVACELYGDKKESRFVENNILHPSPAEQSNQLYGDVWEWTGSSYLPYPFYEKKAGALGEYNGKFMINQMVLRGGSCATPISHIRSTYRNFFPTDARWQFTGIRLAKWLK